MRLRLKSTTCGVQLEVKAEITADTSNKAEIFYLVTCVEVLA
jgi:hypothetical protein